MASAKDLKKKIRTTANTKKITGTMEMVATARSKRAQNRVQATTPYSNKLAEILEGLAQSGSISHPFLERADTVERSVLLVVTANRGLCGGYNSAVVSMAERWLEQEAAEGRKTDVHMIGKKGISRFRFLRVPTARSYTHIEDRPTFQDAEAIARELMASFLNGEIQRVVVISTRYLTSTNQKPMALQLLPVAPASDDGDDAPTDPASSQPVDFIFEPDRDAILDQLLPLSITQALYRAFLEAAVSEQIARRIAMKLATDNAEEMIKTYTRQYNRQRQAGITQQITEIVSGAEALE